MEGCGLESCWEELGCGLRSCRQGGLRGGELRGGARLRGNDVASPARSAGPEPRALVTALGGSRVPGPASRRCSPPRLRFPPQPRRHPSLGARLPPLAGRQPRHCQAEAGGRGCRGRAGGRVRAVGTGGRGPAGRQAAAPAVACPASSLRRPHPAHGDRCPGRGLPGRWRPRA